MIFPAIGLMDRQSALYNGDNSGNWGEQFLHLPVVRGFDRAELDRWK